MVAALLHDIGHLLDAQGEGVSALGVHTRHEVVGAGWLSEYLNRAVTEPIRLHVAAKRYLCAREPGYVALLSVASQESLALQGGPMSHDERRTFEQNPWARDAEALRRWDDAATVPELDVPGLDHYRERLVRQLVRR